VDDAVVIYFQGGITMNKSMFLLEVYEKSIYGNKHIVKRRISDNISSIEDWIKSNAQRWALLPVTVECDYYGNGKIYLSDDPNCVLYSFSTTNIATI
jgi:hypothetical protein